MVDWYELAAQHHFGDLHRIERSALAQVVADNEQRQAMGHGGIAADAADMHRILTGHFERIGHFAQHHARCVCQQFGRAAWGDRALELDIDGERVASEYCTVVDDGTLASRRGSLSIDDEGVPSQCTTLIENGILRGYLQDQHNARLMGTRSTGNGRRESFAHMTLPRMTNTYMRAGPHDPGEIIASVDRGIYAVNFGGGQVDITSGKFVFSASEAYLIENGRIGPPIKGATLVGNGPDVLTRVSMVGNDLQLDAGIGVCGKEGQSVPVGVGQPTLRVDAMTVGGTGS